MHNKLNMTEIPFKFMKHSTRFKLANKLDPKATLTGNDWRMLAEKLGYKSEEITVIEAQRSEDGRNTLKLFAHYEKQEDCSVNRVLEALQEMERKDALEVLQEALPEIEKNYNAEMEVQRKHRSQPIEHELQHWPQTNSYPSNSTNYHCNYSCQPSQSRHVHPAVYNSYEYYPFPSPYKSQTNDHIRRPHSRKTQYPSFTYNGNSCPVHNNHTGEMEVQSRQNDLSQDMRSFLTEEDNSSMMVQPDLNSRDEFSIVENNIVMRDDQVPLPKAIFQAQNLMMNIPSHGSDDFDIAREEEVSTSTSEDFSSGDSDLVPLGERKDYYRQRSDECNSNQPLKDAGLRNTKSSCIPKSLSDHDVPLENLKRLANLPKQYIYALQKYVLITYGDREYDTKIEHLIEELIKQLEDNQINVIVYMSSRIYGSGVLSESVEHKDRQSHVEALESFFNKASCVIVGITPGYISYTSAHQNEAEASLHQQDTRSIYMKMYNEFHRNNSLNKRLFPVKLVSKRIRTDDSHIPSWMQSTTRYIFKKKMSTKNLIEHLKCQMQK